MSGRPSGLNLFALNLACYAMNCWWILKACLTGKTNVNLYKIPVRFKGDDDDGDRGDGRW